MKLSKIALGATAIALVSAPIAAQADMDFARATAPVTNANELGTDTEITPAAVVAALAAIGIGVLLLVDDDDDDDDDVPISV